MTGADQSAGRRAVCRGSVGLTVLIVAALVMAALASAAPTATRNVSAIRSAGFAETGSKALERGVALKPTGPGRRTARGYRLGLKSTTSKKGGDEGHFASITPEAPETAAASDVGSSAATLNGVLNPKREGEEGTYEFVYRQSATECEREGSPENTIPSPPATAPATSNRPPR